MDVRKGPLSRARANAIEFGVSERIDLRISDGLEGLDENVDIITIFGMGGRLISRIITDASDKIGEETRLIVSPQSDIPMFREFLEENAFEVEDEKCIVDEGKYYFIMQIKKGRKPEASQDEISHATYMRFGKYLLESKDQTLKEFILKEKANMIKVRDNLKKCDSDNIRARLNQLEFELACIKKGLSYYEM